MKQGDWKVVSPLSHCASRKTQIAVTTCCSRKHSLVGEDSAREHLFPEGSEAAQQEQPFIEEKPDKD